MEEKVNRLEYLNHLLEYSTPIDLRHTIQQMFFAYLNEQNDQGFDKDFKEVNSDVNLLIEFFDKLEING